MTADSTPDHSQASTRSFPNPLLRGLRLPDTIQSANPWYGTMRWGLRLLMPMVWKVRVFGRHNEPEEGGVVYISNHQSFLDPMLMSFALRRPMSYMARDTLFRMPGFRHIIESLNAFPVRRGTADTGAMKEAMRRLKAGRQVVVFAEGTRTADGSVGPFLPGVALLAQRAAEWTVPVVIDGAFEAWPRTQKLPSPGGIVVQYGPPIARDEARRHKPQEFIDRIRDIIVEMQADVRRRAGKPALDYK